MKNLNSKVFLKGIRGCIKVKRLRTRQKTTIREVFSKKEKMARIAEVPIKPEVPGKSQRKGKNLYFSHWPEDHTGKFRIVDQIVQKQ